jgi:hypothetical protein
MYVPMQNIEKPLSKFTTILWLGLLTGTLDGLAAIIWGHNTKATTIFKFIASGMFGAAAFKGGTVMVLWGILFHYIIAFAFTAAFFVIYPSFISALKNKYLTAIIFALITWLITNLLVVPLSLIGWRPIDINSIIIGIVILIFTIGLPIAFVANKYYLSR